MGVIGYLSAITHQNTCHLVVKWASHSLHNLHAVVTFLPVIWSPQGSWVDLYFMHLPAFLRMLQALRQCLIFGSTRC